MFQKKLCVAMVVVFCLCIAASLFAEEKKPITNSIGMKFVYIPPGTFMMGSPKDEPNRKDDETQHKVTLSKGFYMQTTEVTQGQWKAIMVNNPSHFKDCGDNCPVENVSWNDIQPFIVKMNERGEGTYRLPTETEWEYAARAGTTTAYHWGVSADCSKANCEYCKGKNPVAVGSFAPNAWGLYDMSGNVWEWCQDGYTLASGSFRATRGGSWLNDALRCRSADRGSYQSGDKNNGVGFRLVRSE